MGTEARLTERDRHDADATATLLVPQSLGPGTIYSPTVDMSDYARVVFEILGGPAGATGDTIIISVQESLTAQAAQDGPTASSRALASGAKITTLPATAGAGFATRDDLWLITVQAEELDVDAYFRYLQLKVVTTGTSWMIAAKAVRSIAAYEPVAVTNVTEIAT